MIELRLVQGDTATQYFKARRDERDVFIQTVDVKLRCPSGVTKTGLGVVEDGGAGEFRVVFGTGGLTLTEVGAHTLEFFFNGLEHAQEPLKVWVRPEHKRGPE